MNRQPDRVTRQNLGNYDTAWSVEEYTREEGLRPLEAALVHEFFPKPPATVLDLGCGAGRTTIGLARGGYTVTGIDLSETLLDEARERYPGLDFRVMDATRLVFPGSCFDAALFSYNGIDCIYPVGGRVTCLAEVFRVLKPGGTFLFSSHNVIGAFFSGGYFYPRGYWNAAKMIAQQLGNALVLEWYWRYRDGGGIQRLYSAPPGRTLHQLARVGFRVLAVRGEGVERSRGAALMHQQHVHFAARRPA